MPVWKRTIEYYTCKFRCGAKAKPLYGMEQHEKICFCNPETMSCRMCAFFIVNSTEVGCELMGYEMGNGVTNHVYDATSGSTVYDGEAEGLKCCKDIFYVPQERPFPRSNCAGFKLSKKAY